MKIKKIGHCCLVIDTGTARILTDPGHLTTAQESESGIDIILITHEHSDHVHVDSLARVLEENPDAEVVANDAVGQLLVAEGISSRTLESGRLEMRGVTLDAFEAPHEEIFEDLNLVPNTGYLINEFLYFPGDSFHTPGANVQLLALPVAGPWCRVADAVRFAIAVRPKAAFPVHDGLLNAQGRDVQYSVPTRMLPEHGIAFRVMGEGQEIDFSDLVA